MPLVIVKHTYVIHGGFINKLAKALPEIVALALSVENNPEAHLSPADIEVWVHRANELDVNAKNLEIVIWANLYPERLANLNEREERIRNFVKKFLADVIPGGVSASGFVWVLLANGAFGEL